MTTDDLKTARDRAQAILDRADQLDNLVASVIADLKVHVDLLRDEVDTQERASDERA